MVLRLAAQVGVTLSLFKSQCYGLLNAHSAARLPGAGPGLWAEAVACLLHVRLNSISIEWQQLRGHPFANDSRRCREAGSLLGPIGDCENTGQSLQSLSNTHRLVEIRKLAQTLLK